MEAQSILSQPERLVRGYIPDSLLELVRETTQSAELRRQLGMEERVWESIGGSFEDALRHWDDESEEIPFLRTFNGVAIVARNLVSATGGQAAQKADQYKCFTRAVEVLSKRQFQSSSELEFAKLSQSLWQFLANGCLCLQIANTTDEVETLLGLFTQILEISGLAVDNIPLLVILELIARDSRAHKQAVDILCKSKNALSLVNKVLIETPLWYGASENQSDSAKESDRMITLVHSIAGHLIYYGSLGIFFQTHAKTQGAIENTFLKIIDAALEKCVSRLSEGSCISATSVIIKQLNICSQWALPFIKNADLNPEYSEAVQHQIFEIWNSLNLCLDMIHCLLDSQPYGTKAIKDFLVNNTDIVKELVALLGECQQYLPKRSKLADLAGFSSRNNGDNQKIRPIEEVTPGSDLEYEPKDFPLVKGKIIYILGVLCQRTPKVQDEMRELHGLELVLSNCIIDLNNPYIKERSIVCIRCLLEGNEANQAFVAKMEAKQSVTPEALDEAGFETEIIDGKIALKRKRDASN